MIRISEYAVALVLACAGITAAPAQSFAASALDCPASAEFVRLSKPLVRFSARLLHNEDITILALGSSSTEGTGASRPEFNYPNQLASELRRMLPRARVKVLNRGVGGEDVRQMLPRLNRYLASEKPDLVLWQVGTNALLAEKGVDAQAPLILDGVRKIRAGGVDVILMNPQYAPYVLRDPDARPMVKLLAKVADETGVPVFHRFELMQYWHEAREVAFSDFLAPDLFHMNDWSYGCLARNLAAALVASANASPEDAPAAASASTVDSAAPAAPSAPASAPVTSVSALR